MCAKLWTCGATVLAPQALGVADQAHYSSTAEAEASGYRILMPVCWAFLLSRFGGWVQQWVQTWITFTNAGQSFRAGPKVGKTLSLGSEIGRTVHQALRPDWGINWFCTWHTCWLRSHLQCCWTEQLPGSQVKPSWVRWGTILSSGQS